MRGNIRDCEPSTSCLRRNIYHLHVPLFVFDTIRLFQDHPKFLRGLKEYHIIDMLEKEWVVKNYSPEKKFIYSSNFHAFIVFRGFACGDVEAQVKMALKELSSTGFVRYINNGYRTLGPFARLALARTPRQFNIAWDRLCELQKISTTSLSSSFSSRSPSWIRSVLLRECLCFREYHFWMKIIKFINKLIIVYTAK